MTQAELDSDSNLLVLCKRDHKLVDDQPNHYTIEKLRRIKAEHRKRINSLREGQRRGAGQAEKVAARPSVVRRGPYVPDSAPAWGASVRNGSELPVYQVHVEFVPIERWQDVNVVIFEVIPPGEWLVSGSKLYLNSEPAPSGPHLWDMPERTFVIELGFGDTNGQSWHRSSGGVLARTGSGSRHQWRNSRTITRSS
jgi:hypothetical protein